jgi:PRTRC genetic system protein C
MKKVRRVFLYKKEEMKDPDPSLTPVEVAKYYSMQIPELTNGSVNYKGLKIEGDDEFMEYELSTSIGVKG